MKFVISNKRLRRYALIKIILILTTLIFFGLLSTPGQYKYLVNSHTYASTQLTPFLGSSQAPLKFLFINLNNTPYFDAIIDGTIDNKFRKISPFKENFNLISFYKTSIYLNNINEVCKPGSIDLSAGFVCNPTVVYEAVNTKHPEFDHNDFINLAFVQSDYGGSAGKIITICVPPSFPNEEYAASTLDETVIHEISHNFGLMDYYNGTLYYDGSPNSVWPPEYLKLFYNIDGAGCSKWCKSYKDVTQYNQSPSSVCLSFGNKDSCLSYNRNSQPGSSDYCPDGNCCIWSDTPFEYFNSRCAPWKGDENIGLQCIQDVGCYFSGAYSHFVWRPFHLQTSSSIINGVGDTIMLGGNGDYDSVSEKHIESVFRCCMNSTYSSSLTSELDCANYKNDFEKFLNSNKKKVIGHCKATYIISTTPTTTSYPTTEPTSTPASSTPGDANNDGKVDITDFVIWRYNYNLSLQGRQYGDFNHSGKVDGIDYIIWFKNYTG